MKAIGRKFNSRFGYDGWALETENGHILKWTFSTTREEVRELKNKLEETMNRNSTEEQLQLFAILSPFKIIKVVVNLEKINDLSESNPHRQSRRRPGNKIHNGRDSGDLFPGSDLGEVEEQKHG